jgi:hypothetical protein
VGECLGHCSDLIPLARACNPVSAPCCIATKRFYGKVSPIAPSLFG